MNRLRKFFHLPKVDKILVIKSVILIIIAKLVLTKLPLKITQQFITYLSQALPKAKTISIENISWAIDAVGNNLFGPKNCLSKALAAQVLLKHYGYPAELNFGVYKGKDIKFEAHAWIRCNNKVIIGAEALEYYTPLS